MTQEMEISQIGDTDISYEQQLLQTPHDIQLWLRYYYHKDTDEGRLFVLSRAVRVLKRSYKLWIMYLDLLVDMNASLEVMTQEFEHSLELLNMMPLIWTRYLRMLMKYQSDVSVIRRTFNRSLQNLSLLQHRWIWPLFLEFADVIGGATGCLVYKRYLTYEPEELELVLEKMIEFGDFDESVKLFEQFLTEGRVSSRGKSPLDLWIEYYDLLSSNKAPKTLKHDGKVEEILREGFKLYPDQAGSLYVRLATYFIKRKDYFKAMDIFDEGIKTVLTIKDFTMIYDSYTEFMESLVTKLMESNPEDGSQQAKELDYRIFKFEKLMDMREFLLDDVKIRQNPNNVDNWLHKASLYKEEEIAQIIQTYVDAITKTEPQKCPGLSKVWIKYSEIYEQNGDLQTARTILDKAVKVPFQSPDELADVWIHWSELELRQDDLEMAIKVLEIATRSREKCDYRDNSLTVQERVHKSIKLWGFYLDLVESSGDVEKTCKVYDDVFELKIATPLTVVNYANFLEDQNRFEEAFKVYERGVGIFHYPVVFEIWNIYLTKAMARHLPLERMRDLFDQALDGCPEDLSKSIYILYSKVEEEQGSVQRAVKVLERGVDKVSMESKPEIFEFLIQKTLDHFGAISTRPIYQKAIETLPPSKSLPFVIKFAQTELQLHEPTRTRAILQHGAMLQSPAKSKELWDWWAQFEVDHGDKDTFKEMLRWKRRAADEFDYNTGEVEGFVKSTDGPKVSSINASEQEAVNPDAIDLDI